MTALPHTEPPRAAAPSRASGCGQPAAGPGTDTHGPGGDLSRDGQGAARSREIPINGLPAAIWSGEVALLGETCPARIYVLENGARLVDLADLPLLVARLVKQPKPEISVAEWDAFTALLLGKGVPA